MQLSCGEPHMQLKQPSGINELRVQNPAYDSRMNLQYSYINLRRVGVLTNE